MNFEDFVVLFTVVCLLLLKGSTANDQAKSIPSKWVYRLKLHLDGSIDKFKVRLVIKGFAQREEMISMKLLVLL